METGNPRSSGNRLTDILFRVTPRDILEATGPLVMAATFAFVLYGIQVPFDFLVFFGFGLLYWPLYEIVGLLAGLGLGALFRTLPASRKDAFRNGLLPLGLGIVVIGLFYFGQWVWLVIFSHLLGLVLGRTEVNDRGQGCRQGVTTGLLLLAVLFLIVVGLPTKLSDMFQFPNVVGDLVFLPGMLIIGIGYYLLMAGSTVVISSGSRHGGQRN
ncbi:MAG: hypothetical protein KKG47_11255 [Proteobacteria bacterium]|nr:hypothetical protein [Pseudomonadota bacterium]MBU1739391.1 hypothetical protein [Pseudomonadota bacterium]